MCVFVVCNGKYFRYIIWAYFLSQISSNNNLLHTSLTIYIHDVHMYYWKWNILHCKSIGENIHVRSILGRLLEHSRIYYFSDGKKDPLQGKFFIGSSDVMRRSFQERVELAVPLLHLQTRQKLWEYIEILKSSHCKRWQMNSDGTYSFINNEKTYDIQDKWISEKT